MKEKIIHRKKAAFSVEAAWVFGISLIILYILIAFSFTMYQETYDYIDATEADELNAVQTFRLVQEGKTVVSGLLEKSRYGE